MKVRRGDLTDHYVENERSVVMVDESVLGLSPVATTILEAVPPEVDIDLLDVTQHVVDTFGPPEGRESAEDLTRQYVWDLVAHRVLRVVDDDASATGSSHSDSRHHGSRAAEQVAAVNALRDALRHLRSTVPGRWTPPASVSAASFVAAARQHHVEPFLAAHLDCLDLPDRARSELKAAAGSQRAGARLLAADLSVALDALAAARVRALAFKGVALASQAYGDFAIRGAGDLDLLVPAEDVARAHDALSAAGWTSPPGYPVPGDTWAWRHFVSTGYELTLTSDLSDIDLHWHLVPTRSTFPGFEALWSRREIVAVDGHSIATLSRYDALTHSAGHSAKDGWRWLRSLVDVHLLLSDSETWLQATRPLRPDQLRTVGLSAREFGTPLGAPQVVYEAAREMDDRFLEQVRRDQSTTTAQHRPLSAPGLQLLRRLHTIRLTRGSARETVRLVSRTALPPWITAFETSPSALVAIPRVLARRTIEVASRLRPASARQGRQPASRDDWPSPAGDGQSLRTRPTSAA